MKTHIALFSLAVFFMSFGSASAFSTLSGKDISLKNPVTDDFYSAGGDIDIDQPVNGDVTIFGGSVNISEDVSGDVLVFGGRVTISGNVKDDVRIFGGTATISGNVKDDVVAVGGNIELARTASVGGSVMTHGGIVSIDGSVSENVTGTASIMKIKGWINGFVHVDAHNYLSISSSAKIRGNLSYFSKNPSVIPDGVVSGTVERVAPSWESYKGLLFGFYSLGLLLAKFWGFLSLLLIGGILLAIYPQEFTKWPEGLRKHFWKHLGIGFLGLTSGIAFVIFCMVTLIGVPLGLLLALGGAAIWYISQLVAGLFIGTLIFKPKPRSPRRTFGVLALGLFIYTLVSLIPYIGPFATFVLVLAAFGVLVRRKYEWALVLRGKK